MLNVEGKEYYGIGIDNNDLRKEADKSKSILKSIGNSAEAEGARIDNAFRNAAAGAAAFFTAQQATAFINKIIEVRGQFQKFEAVLTNTLGSNSEAKKIMDDLNNFALSTPFNYDELVGAFVKLANQGFKPTMDEMTKLGDLASSTGKSFDQLAEAIIDAQVGEMERLKEFGVRASKDGDKITFTFKEQETVVKNSASAIREYLLSLGEMKGVQGANAEIAKTLVTQVSNLQGAIMNMYNEIGQQTEGVLSDSISSMNYLVEHYEEVGKALGVLVASYGTYKAAVIATVVVQKAAVAAGNVTTWFQLAKGIQSAKDAQLLFNLATKANPYVLAATAIVALGTAIWAFGGKAKTAADHVKEFNDEVDKQRKAYADLLSVLVDENASIAERQGALNTLRTIQPEVYKNMTLEEAAAINLTKATNDLNKAYDEKNKKKLEEWRDTYKQQIGFKTISRDTALTRSDFQNARKFQKEIDDYNEKLNIVEGKLAFINESIEETKNLEAQAAAEAKKKAQSEIQTLETLKKKKKEIEDSQDKVSTKEEYDKLEKQKLAVKKQMEAITGASKETLKAEADRVKSSKDLNEKTLENELKLQAERISIMQDGKNKRIALVGQEYKETLAAINKEREEYRKSIKDAKGTEDPAVIASFSRREMAAGAKKITDTANIEKEYAREYKERTKSMTDVFLGEEQRKLSAIKDRYDKERKWAKEQRDTGGMTEFQYTSYTNNIDKAQSKETYEEILSGLNDFEQQKAEIEQTWNARIEAARDKNDLLLEMRLQKGKSKALSGLNAQKLQESEEWQQLFGDLDNLTASQIDNLVNIIESRAKELKLDPVDARELTNSLNAAKQKLIEVNPFSELGKSLKSIFANGAKDSKKETNDIKKDWKDLAKSTEGCFEFVNDAVASCSVLGDILGESGQQIIGMIQGVATAGIAMAAAIKTAESASVVLTAISMALTAVTALFSIFNGDKKKEKEIQRLQDQVDALGKSYDRLGRSIEKAYSKDASRLIEQQNKNLQQQNAVIRKQIEAERSKKKSDKDKIKEWQNTIDENNRIIEDNKDKAVDAIFGSDVKSAIEDFASAYADAWGAGEDRAKAMKDVVKNMIKGVVVEMIKSDLAPTVTQLRAKIQKALADNIISDAEQAEIDALIEAATSRADTKYASLDKYMKDAEEKETRSAQAQGIATASQESVDKNNGLLANVQFYVAKGVGLLETAVAIQAASQSDKTNPLLSVAISINDNLKAVTQLFTTMVKHLAGIETNTSYCKKLESIDKNISRLKGSVEEINTKGTLIRTP